MTSFYLFFFFYVQQCDGFVLETRASEWGSGRGVSKLLVGYALGWNFTVAIFRSVHSSSFMQWQGGVRH